MPEVEVINGRRVIRVSTSDCICDSCTFAIRNDAIGCITANCKSNEIFIDAPTPAPPTGRALYALGYVPTNLFHPE